MTESLPCRRRSATRNVSGSIYAVAIDGDRIWTAAELEALTPNERDAIVRAGFITDPEKAPPDGEPSASDFLLIDLPAIADSFGERFDELPPVYVDRSDYRFLVATGRLVRAVAVTGQLMDDGSIVRFGIDIDPA